MDLGGGNVAYTGVNEATAASPPQRVTHSGFRKWIRSNQATLDESMVPKGKVSPSAELAKRVVTFRQSLGMTQAQLAHKLGISRPSVAFLETGRTSSVRKHIPRLAEIFQVPVDVFLTGFVEETVIMKLTSDENDLIALYRRLTPEGKLTAQKWLERQTRRSLIST